MDTDGSTLGESTRPSGNGSRSSPSPSTRPNAPCRPSWRGWTSRTPRDRWLGTTRTATRENRRPRLRHRQEVHSLVRIKPRDSFERVPRMEESTDIFRWSFQGAGTRGPAEPRTRRAADGRRKDAARCSARADSSTKRGISMFRKAILRLGTLVLAGAMLLGLPNSGWARGGGGGHGGG